MNKTELITKLLKNQITLEQLANELQLSKTQLPVIQELAKNYMFGSSTLEQTVRSIEEYIK